MRSIQKYKNFYKIYLALGTIVVLS
jgi:hypothetical protein